MTWKGAFELAWDGEEQMRAQASYLYRRDLHSKRIQRSARSDGLQYSSLRQSACMHWDYEGGSSAE
jgi:hypothetical protein